MCILTCLFRFFLCGIDRNQLVRTVIFFTGFVDFVNAFFAKKFWAQGIFYKIVQLPRASKSKVLSNMPFIVLFSGGFCLANKSSRAFCPVPTDSKVIISCIRIVKYLASKAQVLPQIFLRPQKMGPKTHFGNTVRY